MKALTRLAILSGAVAVCSPCLAAGYGVRPIPNTGIVGPYGEISGRAPWNAPYEYDSGSDNDRFPERPYYQQGRGQQTGGPARNLLPDDGIHLFPR